LSVSSDAGGFIKHFVNKGKTSKRILAGRFIDAGQSHCRDEYFFFQHAFLMQENGVCDRII